MYLGIDVVRVDAWMDGWMGVTRVQTTQKKKQKKKKAQMVSFLTKPFKNMFKINRAKGVALKPPNI